MGRTLIRQGSVLGFSAIRVWLVSRLYFCIIALLQHISCSFGTGRRDIYGRQDVYAIRPAPRLFVDEPRFRSRFDMLVNLFPFNTLSLGSGTPNCDIRVSVYG